MDHQVIPQDEDFHKDNLQISLHCFHHHPKYQEYQGHHQHHNFPQHQKQRHGDYQRHCGRCVSLLPFLTTTLTVIFFLFTSTCLLVGVVTASYVVSPSTSPVKQAGTNNVSTTVFCRRPSYLHSGMLMSPRKNKYPDGFLAIIQCWDGNTMATTCQSEGTWSRALNCPMTNNSCPSLSGDGTSSEEEDNFETLFSNGNAEVKRPSVAPASVRYPLDTKIRFSCKEGFTLEGSHTIVCGIKFVWSYRVPRCSPDEDSPSETKSSSTWALLTTIWTVIAIVALLLALVALPIFFKWRQRRLQRKKWQRYFGNYTYRQSKHHINHQMRRQAGDLPSAPSSVSKGTSNIQGAAQANTPSTSSSHLKPSRLSTQTAQHLQHHPSTTSSASTATTSSSSTATGVTTAAIEEPSAPPLTPSTSRMIITTSAHIPVTDL